MTAYEWAELNETVKAEEVARIMDEHGRKLEDFQASRGVKDVYDCQDVLDFLGY